MIAFICSALESPDDQEYMIHIYLKYERLMYKTAGKYASNRQDCEDIVQESIARLIQKIDYLRRIERCVLPSYLVSTVKNTSINYLKQRALLEKYRDSFTGGPETQAFDVTDFAQLIHHKTQISEMWEQLSPEIRFLLEGKYILGYSDLELAEYLECRPNSIRMKLTRARRKALEILKQQEEGENNEQKGTTSGKI